MQGFARARGEWIGFVDADGSTPPEAFQDLVDGMGEADVVMATRWRKGAQVSPKQPLRRRIASRAFNGITRILFGLRLTDTQCGAKLMRRECLMKVLPNLGLTQWAFDVDLLFQLKRSGCKLAEIPTVWHDVEGSKIRVGRVSAEMLLAVVRLRLLYSPLRWIVSLYDRTFGRVTHP
jgi:glycosyltransferase involved in cell wall biosynthesis